MCMVMVDAYCRVRVYALLTPADHQGLYVLLYVLLAKYVQNTYNSLLCQYLVFFHRTKTRVGIYGSLIAENRSFGCLVLRIRR
jgi:hypothetical protein